MNVVAIIQARMTSERLPGKVLKQILGKPMLSYQIERLRRAKSLSQVVIATTTNETDDPVEVLAVKEGVGVFRGSEHDVLSRYWGAAQKHHAQTVIRINGDCPLIDPTLVDDLVSYYQNNFPKNVEYAANNRTYPRGQDTEIFSIELLERAHKNAHKPYEREHVTPYFYQNPELFKVHFLDCEPSVRDFRMTVDTAEDFKVIEELIHRLYPQNNIFGWQEIVEELKRDPVLRALNKDIQQKPL